MFIAVCDACDPAFVGPERADSLRALRDFDRHVASASHQSQIASAIERKRQELADLAAFEAEQAERFGALVDA